METDHADVLGVSLERLQAGLVLVVPDLDHHVVGARHKERFFAALVVIDRVDALGVALQRVVGRRRPDRPDLDRRVERRRGERVRVLRVEHHLHHVMRMAFKRLPPPNFS